VSRESLAEHMELHKDVFIIKILTYSL
jgi:hypothetical protein